jgi:glyoxylase-like metal-dependent hydrolase (beta-lactamase superfamily II)
MAENQIKKHLDKEINYVIYSHDRADFISGGEVFEDTAVIIAHKNKYEAIID